MHYKGGSYTTVHVVLKPHALNSLLGMNAAVLADGFVELNALADGDLNGRLVEAPDEQGLIALLTGFLLRQLERVRERDGLERDRLVEEGLSLIQRNVAAASVKRLVEQLHISERQFQRRFKETVGVTPQSYIRVARFNEAVGLIKSGQYERLTDVAHALNFYDQSHLIREIKAFSGLTPTKVRQKEDGVHHAKTGYSFV